jgi:MOSC domain-containing protein YiiM
MPATILALSSDASHRFSKQPSMELRLIAGLGVRKDAHAGATVQHLSRMAKDPALPNLRQVHLIHAELLDELADHGFCIQPGELGENIMTQGIDLLRLSGGTRLRFPTGSEIETTGLRNPCHQLNKLVPGLMEAVLGRATDGSLIRKCGVMAVVVVGGLIAVGDEIEVVRAPEPFEPLGVV